MTVDLSGGGRNVGWVCGFGLMAVVSREARCPFYMATDKRKKYEVRVVPIITGTLGSVTKSRIEISLIINSRCCLDNCDVGVCEEKRNRREKYKTEQYLKMVQKCRNFLIFYNVL